MVKMQKKWFLTLLIMTVVLLASALCYATQTVTNSINASTETGTQLATDLNSSFTSLLSTNRGSSVPSYKVSGMLWVNNVSGTLETLYVYDGANSLSLGSFNPTTHVFTYANSFPADATLSGNPTATTQSAGNSSTRIATTAFVNATALTLANGTTATTQSAGDNSSKVATTAYVDAGGGAGMNKLATTNAAGAAAVNFGSSVITSTYSRYEIKFDGVYFNSLDRFNLQVSSNNCSSFLAITNMSGSAVSLSGGSQTTFNTVSGDPNPGFALISSDNVGTTSSQGLMGSVTFTNPSASSYQIFSFEIIDPAASKKYSGFGVIQNASAINCVGFVTGNGGGHTMTGAFRIYGFKN